jgi:hypothetical protein
MFSLKQCQTNRELKNKSELDEKNIAAMSATLQTERKKNGDLLVVIDGYVATEDDLRKYNQRLYNEVKEQKGHVITLNNTVIQLEQDKVMLRKYIDKLKSEMDSMTKLNDSTWMNKWTLAYKYDSLNSDYFEGTTIIKLVNGKTLELKSGGSELTYRKSTIDLVFGNKFEDGKLRVFVESKYPGFGVNHMAGTLIDPNEIPELKKMMEKKHWFNGWNIGISATYGWNFFTQKPSLIVGPSMTYSVYNW